MSLNISNEQCIQRYADGVKLINPNNFLHDQYSDNLPLLPQYTVAEVFKFPFNVYFMDTESVIQDINESTVQSCGFSSRKEARGKTTAIAAKKATVEFEFQHDQEVLKTNQMIIREEHYERLSDNIAFPTIAIKFPWYNDDNKTIGIFGCSITMVSHSTCSLADALTAITKTGLLAPTQLSKNTHRIVARNKIDNIYLSPREIECVRLLVKGKTAKQIARLLGLSYRTIEHYLAHLKKKIGVSSKSELIDKAISSIDLF